MTEKENYQATSDLLLFILLFKWCVHFIEEQSFWEHGLLQKHKTTWVRQFVSRNKLVTRLRSMMF